MEITKEQKKQIQKIGKQHHLDFIILYGSQAKGTAGALSDVDIAVYRRGGIDAKEYFEIFSHFFKIFKTNELDVKLVNKADPLFRYYVIRDGVLLYGDIVDYLDFKAYAIRDYKESRSLFRLEDLLVRKHQKELEKVFDVKY